MSKKRGFTLIELIIVVIIIGVLAAISAPMMGNMKAKAICAEAEMGISAINTALMNYKAEHGSYGPSVRFTNADGSAQYYGINNGDLDGTFFKQTNYELFVIGGGSGYSIDCYLTDPAVTALTDEPGTAFILYDTADKGFRAHNFSKSGLRPC